MRINFQITLKEWLEWRRKNLSPVKLFLLHLAEAVWLPLVFLLVASLILTSLSVMKLAPAVADAIPSWTFIVILVLLAAARIFISFFPTLSRPVVKREWQGEVGVLSIRMTFTESGFDYEDGNSTYNSAWSEVADIYKTKKLFIIAGYGEYALIVPKRAFSSKEELEEFLELTYKKTVLDRQATALQGDA